LTAESSSKMEIIGVRGIPIIKPGDDVAETICSAAAKQGLRIEDGDIVVVSQTIVSKAEGSIIRLEDVKPGVEARITAERTGKPPEVVEVILKQAKTVIRGRDAHLITETKDGWICANSGVDISNVSGGDAVATLPKDSDRSARQIRRGMMKHTGKDIAVIIMDTSGRPFRVGQVNVAIGVAGMKPIFDRRNEKDLFGYTLRVKEIAVADEIASAAELVVGEAAEGIPVAVVRGYKYIADDKALGKELIRPRRYDLFV